MPFWRSEEVQKTVWETVFQTNAPDTALTDTALTDTALTDTDAQLVQLLGHARPAVAAQA